MLDVLGGGDVEGGGDSDLEGGGVIVLLGAGAGVGAEPESPVTAIVNFCPPWSQCSGKRQMK